MNPLGSGALVDPRLERTFKISCSVGMALRASLSLEETTVKEVKKIFGSGGNIGSEQVLEVVHKTTSYDCY